jgi:small-conductance mechanosensitive channel
LGRIFKNKRNLAQKIKQEVEKIGLSFAFPSQSVYIEKQKKRIFLKFEKFIKYIRLKQR